MTLHPPALRSCFSGRCRTYLERSAAARHVCTLAGCFSQSSEDAPLQTLLSVTPSSFLLSCMSSDLSYSDTLIVHFTYLLTAGSAGGRPRYARVSGSNSMNVSRLRRSNYPRPQRARPPLWDAPLHNPHSLNTLTASHCQ